jgi:hypothetical protein
MRAKKRVDLDRFVVSRRCHYRLPKGLLVYSIVTCLAVIPGNPGEGRGRPGIQAGMGIWIPASAGMTFLHLHSAILS